MGCLLVLLAAFAPRLIVIFAWIARPAYFGAVFDTWIFPLLGLIFLPFTTLMWLLVGAPPQFKITKATIEHLQKLQKDGKIVEVQNDGALKLKAQ